MAARSSAGLSRRGYEMPSLEEIASLLQAIPPAHAENWTVQTLTPGRLHLSRGPAGEYAVFIEGAGEDFGTLPPYKGLAHSPSVTAVPSGRAISALRLTSEDDHIGNRVIAHIAYELALRLEKDPTLTGSQLLKGVEWVLLLLGSRDGILSPERRSGLVGECLLLRRLLKLARKKGVPASVVLDRWWGHSPARRDFAAIGIGIEVKTTSANTRTHAVAMEQLDPYTPDEKVYVYSVGIKTDPTAPKKLPDFIADVEQQLVSATGPKDAAAVAQFRAQLGEYGYDTNFEQAYRSLPGFAAPHLEPAFFAEPKLDRLKLESFKSNSLPSMVSAVRYDLTIGSNRVDDEEAVLEALLANPPVSSHKA